MAARKTPDQSVTGLAQAEFELQRTMEEAGMEPREYGLWGMVWKLFFKGKSRPAYVVNKKKYILLTIFTGWMGGHRFYCGRMRLGLLYLVFFWSLIPFMMSVLDLLEVIPKETDENGFVVL